MWSSVVLAVAGVVAAARLCRQGARLAGLRRGVNPFEGVRPDECCSRCCAWGHIAPQCSAAVPRCALCGEDYQTSDHRCLVGGCLVKRGHACAHVAARCTSCAGLHLSGQRVPSEEGGPPAGQVVEASSPTTQGAQGANPSQGRDQRAR